MVSSKDTSFAHPDYDGAMEKQDEYEELGRGPANLFKGVQRSISYQPSVQKAQRSINRQGLYVFCPGTLDRIESG